jgi:hypothetical protein
MSDGIGTLAGKMVLDIQPWQQGLSSAIGSSKSWKREVEKAMEGAMTSAEKYQRSLTKINMLSAQGALTQRQASTARENLRQEYLPAMPSLRTAQERRSEMLRGLTGGLGGAAKSLLGAALPMGAGMLGAQSISEGASSALRFLESAAQSASESHKANRRLEAVLRATGQTAGWSAGELNQYAAALAKTSGYSGNATKAAMAGLATMTSVRGDVFKRAVRDAQDLASAFDEDLGGAAKRLGRALEDPLKGMEALKESGLMFTGREKSNITALAKGGDIEGAQRAMLDAVEARVGGAAQATADPFARYQNSLKAIEKTIGETILPYLAAAAEITSQWLEDANSGAKSLSATFDEWAAKLGPVLDALHAMSAMSFKVRAPQTLLESAPDLIPGGTGVKMVMRHYSAIADYLNGRNGEPSAAGQSPPTGAEADRERAPGGKIGSHYLDRVRQIRAEMERAKRGGAGGLLRFDAAPLQAAETAMQSLAMGLGGADQPALVAAAGDMQAKLAGAAHARDLAEQQRGFDNVSRSLQDMTARMQEAAAQGAINPELLGQLDAVRAKLDAARNAAAGTGKVVNNINATNANDKLADFIDQAQTKMDELRNRFEIQKDLAQIDVWAKWSDDPAKVQGARQAALDLSAGRMRSEQIDRARGIIDQVSPSWIGLQEKLSDARDMLAKGDLTPRSFERYRGQVLEQAIQSLQVPAPHLVTGLEQGSAEAYNQRYLTEAWQNDPVQQLLLKTAEMRDLDADARDLLQEIRDQLAQPPVTVRPGP